MIPFVLALVNLVTELRKESHDCKVAYQGKTDLILSMVGGKTLYFFL